MSETTIQSDTKVAEEVAGIAAAALTAVNPVVGAEVTSGLSVAEGAAATIEAPHQTLVTGVQAAVAAQTPAIIAAAPLSAQVKLQTGLTFVNWFLSLLKEL